MLKFYLLRKLLFLRRKSSELLCFVFQSQQRQMWKMLKVYLSRKLLSFTKNPFRWRKSELQLLMRLLKKQRMSLKPVSIQMLKQRICFIVRKVICWSALSDTKINGNHKREDELTDINITVDGVQLYRFISSILIELYAHLRLCQGKTFDAKR